MKLLGNDRSPYVRKIRIVLEEKRIPYDYVLARASEPNSPVPAHNPLGKIPVLLTEAGVAVYDSPVIVEYLDGRFPEPRLIPSDPEARMLVRRWEALGDGVVDATVLVSHDYDKVQTADWHRKHRLKIERGLAAMAHDLGDRACCYGPGFSLADIAVGYALGYLDAVLRDYDWRSEHPRLKTLFDELGERESFRKTAPAG